MAPTWGPATWRAKRAALVNTLFVAVLLGTLGLLVAVWPNLWLGWFSNDPEVLAAGASYLLILGPTHALTAINMELYFAGQGGRRIGWPMVATATRLAFSVGAAVWVTQGGASLMTAFVTVAAGVAVSASISLAGFWRVRWDDDILDPAAHLDRRLECGRSAARELFGSVIVGFAAASPGSWTTTGTGRTR